MTHPSSSTRNSTEANTLNQMSTSLVFARRFFRPKVLVTALFFLINALAIAKFRYPYNAGSFVDELQSGSSTALLAYWWMSILLSLSAATGVAQLLLDKLSTDRSLLIPNFRVRLMEFTLWLLALLSLFSFLISAPALDSANLGAVLVSICALLFSAVLGVLLRSSTALVILCLAAPATLVLPEWSLSLAQMAPLPICMLCLGLSAFVIRNAYLRGNWLEHVHATAVQSASDAHSARESQEWPPAPSPVLSRYHYLPNLDLRGNSLSTTLTKLSNHATFYLSNVLHISPRLTIGARALAWSFAGYTALLLLSHRFWREGQLAEVMLMALVPCFAIYYLPATPDGVNFLPRQTRADVTFWTNTTRTFTLLALVLAAGSAAELLNLLIPTQVMLPGSGLPAGKHDFPGTAIFLIQGAATAPALVMLRMMAQLPSVARFTAHWAPMRDFFFFLGFIFLVASWYGLAYKYVQGPLMHLPLALITGIVTHGIYYLLLRWRFTRLDLAPSHA